MWKHVASTNINMAYWPPVNTDCTVSDKFTPSLGSKNHRHPVAVAQWNGARWGWERLCSRLLFSYLSPSWRGFFQELMTTQNSFLSPDAAELLTAALSLATKSPALKGSSPAHPSLPWDEPHVAGSRLMEVLNSSQRGSHQSSCRHVQVSLLPLFILAHQHGCRAKPDEEHTARTKFIPSFIPNAFSTLFFSVAYLNNRNQ